MDESRTRELLKRLIGDLCAEQGAPLPTTEDTDLLWSVFRGMVNMRPPAPASQSWLAAQDELLSALIAEAGVVTVEETAASPADPRLRLWKGDITRLRVDAIVNAANSSLLGCWRPGHHCIDNAIHTFAGVQLRAECARIMEAQGHEEPTGSAQITLAYNLPSRHVIHTVGPITNGTADEEDRALLASSYRSCLDLAAEHGLNSIAFCSISTGVFAFPKKEAAQIAVATAREWLDAHEERPGSRETAMTVLFTVFSDADQEIYSSLLGL